MNDVSNERIMDSYVGILRISSDDNELYDDMTEAVADSKGNESPLGLSKSTVKITNKLSLENVCIEGQSVSGSLECKDYELKSSDDSVSLHIDKDSLKISSDASSFTITDEGICFNGITTMGGIKVENSCVTFDISDGNNYYLKNNSASVKINLTVPKINEVLIGEAKEPNATYASSMVFKNINEIIDARIEKKLSYGESLQSLSVPVGTITYIALPSLYGYVIKDGNVVIDDNKGYGYTKETAESKIADSKKVGLQDAVEVPMLSLRLPSNQRDCWDYCMGQDTNSIDGKTTYNKTNFPELFKVLCPLDKNEDSGNVSFCLPDLRDVFIKGASKLTMPTVLDDSMNAHPHVKQSTDFKTLGTMVNTKVGDGKSFSSASMTWYQEAVFNPAASDSGGVTSKLHSNVYGNSGRLIGRYKMSANPFSASFSTSFKNIFDFRNDTPPPDSDTESFDKTEPAHCVLVPIIKVQTGKDIY